jgi:hypothetical protein
MKQNIPKGKKKTTVIAEGKATGLLHRLRRRLVKQHWLYSRWGVGLLIILIVLVFSFPSGVGIQAAESRVYPTYCLGGWQNPQNAGGQPNLEMQASARDFNSDNSAVLHDVLADMFCGYFQGETHDNPPSRAVLKFSWQIDSDEIIQPTPEITPVPAEILPVTDTPPVDESPARDPDAASDTRNPAPPEELNLGSPVQAQFMRVHDSVQIAAVDETSETTPIKEIQPEPIPVPDFIGPLPLPAVEPVPEPTPTPEPIGIEPVPAPEPTLEVTPEPTVIEPTPPPVVEISQETSGFLEAQYSFDGLEWHSLGLVNMGNWRSFEPEIPIRSWDDIGKLQVVLSARSTFDRQPTVKLDGMWLETQYNPTFTEAIEDLGEQTNEFLSDLVDTTGDSLTKLNDALTPGEQEAEALKALQALDPNQPTEDATSVPREIIAPPAPSLIAKRHLLFTAGGSAIPTSSILPWFTRDDLKALQLDEKTPTK